MPYTNRPETMHLYVLSLSCPKVSEELRAADDLQQLKAILEDNRYVTLAPSDDEMCTIFVQKLCCLNCCRILKEAGYTASHKDSMEISDEDHTMLIIRMMESPETLLRL